MGVVIASDALRRRRYLLEPGGDGGVIVAAGLGQHHAGAAGLDQT